MNDEHEWVSGVCGSAFYEESISIDPEAWESLRDAEGVAPVYILTGEQERFLELHARTHDYVNRWQLLLGDMYCRATTLAGHTATIHIEALAELIRDGLMDTVGEHGAKITQTGLGEI